MHFSPSFIGQTACFSPRSIFPNKVKHAGTRWKKAPTNPVPPRQKAAEMFANLSRRANPIEPLAKLLSELLQEKALNLIRAIRVIRS
jgi:hypothetical protein